jgi:hypothetical protein
MPSEKRSAEADADVSSKKRRGSESVSWLDDDALSLSLRCLLRRPIANKDIADVMAAHNSNGKKKSRVAAFFELNKEAVLKTLLSLASDRDAEAPDRALAFDLLRDYLSGEENVFDAAFQTMTSVTGFLCDKDTNPIESVKRAAFRCAEENKLMFTDRVAPLLDQLESIDAKFDLQGAQEALRICSCHLELHDKGRPPLSSEAIHKGRPPHVCWTSHRAGAYEEQERAESNLPGKAFA